MRVKPWDVVKVRDIASCCCHELFNFLKETPKAKLPKEKNPPGLICYKVKDLGRFLSDVDEISRWRVNFLEDGPNGGLVELFLRVF